MQKRIFLFVIICALFYTGLQAQDTKKRLQFESHNQFGAVKGASETSFVLQSVNGVRYNTWFAGVGAGLDEYYFSSLPVFMDAKKYLSTKANSFFIYGDGGWNFSLEKNQDDMYKSVKNKGGLYYDVGIGY